MADEQKKAYDISDDRYELNDPVTIIDRDWLKNAFMVPPENYDENERFISTFTLAHAKSFDSSIGGHITVNPPYQYTPYADVPRKGRLATREDMSINNDFVEVGMGNYYSESFDDHLQILSLEFGVPKFNSLVSFFASAVGYRESIVANEGRSPFFYDAGFFIGRVAVYIAFPLPAMLATALSWVTKKMKSIGMISRQFYTMKPMMYNYWASVNSLVTLFASERGVLVPELMGGEGSGDRLGMPMQLDSKDLEELKLYLPDIVMENNYIDIFALANRANIRILAQSRADAEKFTKGSMSSIESYINKQTGALKPFNLSSNAETFFSYFEKAVGGKNVAKMYKEVNIEDQKPATPAEPESAGVHPDDFSKPADDGTLKMNTAQKKDETNTGFKNYYSATVNASGTRATFAVEYVGQSTLTISNSIKDIPLKGVINNIGGAARDVRFSFAGGNVTGVEKSFVDAGKDFIMGQLSGATFGISNVLQALLGGGNLQFNKMWDNSNITLPQHNYKMRLGGPYGSTISKIFDIDIPLAMLFAGALPLRVGVNSYTSPYLCRAFLRGQTDIQMGMITQMTVTKGVGNVGHDSYGRALAVDVSFTITDFSDIMTAPIQAGSLKDLIVGSDPEDPLYRYITLLAGRSYRMSQFIAPKALLEYSRTKFKLSALTSPARTGMWAGDTLFGRVHSLFINDVSTFTADPKM